jgi:hypothetical protein
MLQSNRSVQMIPRRFGARPVRITQAYQVGVSAVPSAGYGTYLSFDPSANLPSWSTNWTNTFEIFRTISARVVWTPAYTESISQTGDVINVPMYSALSPTVSTAPTSANQMLQYQSVRRHQLLRSFSRSAAPCVVSQLFPSTAFNYFPSQDSWSSVGNPPQTNGMLIWIEPSTTGSSLFLGDFLVYITFEVAVPF